MTDSSIQHDPTAMEMERLGLLSRLLDPLTESRLDHIPIQPGWTCLDVGAGEGSVARILARRVGETGAVVASDIDTSHLVAQPHPNIKVLRHNILEDPLEPAQFDLIHCRAVLMHLKSPHLAIEKMAAALKPGGWLLLEEIDAVGFGAVEPESPDGREFERIYRIVHDSLRQWRVLDLTLGRRLPGLIEKSGLVDVGHDGATVITRGGEPGAEFQRRNLQFFQPLVGAGLLTQGDIDTLERVYADPVFAFTGGTCFGAWGRRTS